MLRAIGTTAISFLVLALTSCANPFFTGRDDVPDARQSTFGVTESGAKTKSVPGFEGVIAERYQDSREWWPEDEAPDADAPNVIIFLLDDVGFAQVGSFGALIDTPSIGGAEKPACFSRTTAHRRPSA